MAVATCIATTLEKRRPLPVDAIIPEAIFASTHAITIDAPPEHVAVDRTNGRRSSGLVQLGCDRQRRYAKCDEHDAGVSDRRQRGCDAGGSGSQRRVRRRRRRSTPDLVLTVPDGRGGNAVAWEHVLEPLPGGRTRLIVRGRASSPGSPLLVRRRPPVTAASSSNARMRRWRRYRVRCLSHSLRWATASWKRGICEVFSAAALLRRHDAK